MLISMTAQRADEWLSNLLVLAPGKTEGKRTASQGKVLIGQWGGWTYGVVSDDFVSAIVDGDSPAESQGLGSEDLWFEVDRSQLDEFLTSVRYMTKNDLGQNTFVIDLDDSLGHKLSDFSFWEKVWYMIWDVEEMHPDFAAGFTLNPDRFRKISLLHPRHSGPVAFTNCTYENRSLLYWTCCAINVRGVLATL